MDTGQLVSRMLEAAILHFHLVARLDVGTAVEVDDLAVARLGREHLVGAVAGSVGQTHDVAALLQQQRVAAVAVGGDAVGREAVVGGNVGTDDRRGHRNALSTCRRESIGCSFFRIKIIEHVALGVHVGMGVLLGRIIHHIDEHIGLNTGCRTTYLHHESSGVLGPDGTVERTTQTRTGRGAAEVGNIDGIIGHEDDGSALAHCSHRVPGINGSGVGGEAHNIVAGLAVLVNHGVVEVWLEEVVVGDVVNELPRAHAQDVVGVTHVHLHETLLVDVDEDVAGLIAAVGLVAVVDLFGVTVVIACRQIEGGHLSLVEVGRELAGVRQAARQPGAEVVLKAIAQAVGVNLAAASGLHVLGLYLGEGRKMGLFHTHEETGLGRHRHAVVQPHGNGAAGRGVEGHSAAPVEVYIALFGTGGRGDELGIVAVTVEHGEGALVLQIYTGSDDTGITHLAGNANFHIVVRTEGPVTVGGVGRAGEYSEIGSIAEHIQFDGAVDGGAVGGVGREHIGALVAGERVLVGGRLTHFHGSGGGLVDERHRLGDIVHRHGHIHRPQALEAARQSQHKQSKCFSHSLLLFLLNLS